MSERHHNYAWSKLRRQRLAIAKANLEACVLCHGEIDYTLHHANSWSATTEHTQPLALGGDLLPGIADLAVAHRICQGRQGGVISGLMKGKVAKPRNVTKADVIPIKSRSEPVGDRESGPNRGSSRSPISISQPSSKIVSSGATRSTPTTGKVIPPGDHPTTQSSPRIITPDPPDLAGSLAEDWISWLGRDAGIELRPWQRLVLEKALQVDGDGRLIWDEIGISTPRQSGKSWLIRSLAMARCQFSDHFGEPQEVGHLANNLVTARRIQRQSWRWANLNKMTVRQGIGDERVIWNSGSVWFLSSLKAIYGASAHVAMIDECWDIREEEVTEGVQPIVVERDQSQLWMLSTANEMATPLFLNFRRKALNNAPRVLLIEWSADPKDDLDDPAVWRSASPHWSERRERMIASADKKTRKYQFLNVWPDELEVAAGWPAGFSSCPSTKGQEPPLGAVGAIEVSQDRSRFGAAIAVRLGSSIAVWTALYPDLDRAVEWLNEHDPAIVFTGVSLKTEVEAIGSFVIKPAGTAESRLATPNLQALVSRKALAHDHSESLLEEVAHARTTVVETGELLSAKRSTGPISTLKALAWAVWGASTGEGSVEESQIF